jgi:hypothetical protein
MTVTITRKQQAAATKAAVEAVLRIQKCVARIVAGGDDCIEEAAGEAHRLDQAGVVSTALA